MEPTLYTFGIELEFIILVPKPSHLTPPTPLGKFSLPPTIPSSSPPLPITDDWLATEDASDLLFRDIAQTLYAAGIPADPTDDWYLKRYDIWQVLDDMSIRPPSDLPSHTHAFTVELVSRILPYGDKGCEVVRRVCEVLRGRYEVVCNESTGLHVHVGMRSLRPGLIDLGIKAAGIWELEHLKRLNAFVFAFSEVLDTLHEPSRLMMDPDVESWYGSIRRPFCSDSPVCPPREVVAKILAAKKGRELLGLNRTEKDSAYNFRGAIMRRESEEDCKSTVEFRQHAGTVDDEAILAWLHVVVRIVSWTKDVQSKKQLWEMLEKGLSEGEDEGKALFGVLDLLEEVGVRRETIEYYRMRGLYCHPRRVAEEYINVGSDPENMMTRVQMLKDRVLSLRDNLRRPDIKVA